MHAYSTTHNTTRYSCLTVIVTVTSCAGQQKQGSGASASLRNVEGLKFADALGHLIGPKKNTWLVQSLSAKTQT